MSLSPSLDEAVVDAAFEADAYGVLEFTVPGAHVRLRPHTEDSRVHIRGFVPDANPESAREIFDRKGISTQQARDRLHVLGDPLSANVEDWRWRRTHHTSVYLDVHLPPAMDVTAQTPGGTVDAAGLTGAVELTVRGGSVHTEQLDGSLDVRGSGEALTVRDCSGSLLDLQWSAGEVTLEQITGASTTLRARSAPTTLSNLQGPADLTVQGAPLTLRDLDGPCEAQVRGGALTFHGPLAHDTFLTAVGGPLRAHLPPSATATVSLAGTRVALDDTFDFDGEQTPERIVGTLNGGGPKLRGHAVQGSVRCSARTGA
ncbi:MAG: hypothetical protein BRD30_08890 [Bacteroidetes bacterium QH_2_63_10]|nr:MAG: hypothetical protein BRD30_08890 [Bacteroidetes bacterium QH_2_63_10]